MEKKETAEQSDALLGLYERCSAAAEKGKQAQNYAPPMLRTTSALSKTLSGETLARKWVQIALYNLHQVY